MNALRRYILRVRDDERGAITPMMLMFVPMLMIIVGLVVDGAGKIQANDEAQMIASGASRAAANALASQVIANGSLLLDTRAARNAAMDYVQAAGMTGTVDVIGGRIVVNVQTEYATKFISVLGINALSAEATATAELITQ